jgi:hypothetical protein
MQANASCISPFRETLPFGLGMAMSSLRMVHTPSVRFKLETEPF